MVSRRHHNPPPRPRRPPATTPDGRENQLIGMATDLAEKQLLEGTASAQVISHLLKLGSSRERLEQERLTHEVEMLKVKKKQIEDMTKMDELFKEAIHAMRGYQGTPDAPLEDEFDD